MMQMIRIIRNKLTIHPYFFPVLVSVPAFGIIGGYGGFVESQHEPLFHNVFDTTVGSLSGCVCGGLLGLAWPITVPVLAGRMLMSASKPK